MPCSSSSIGRLVLAAAPAAVQSRIILIYIVISGHCIVAADALSLDDAKVLKVLCFGEKYLFTVNLIRNSGLSGW